MRIGVLEDDMVQQGLYKLWFATAGYSCACYGTAEAFERALGQENFDLLIIDWMLPDSTGEVVLQRVRERRGWEVAVIFVTSRESETDIVNALRSGADDYLVKPPKYQELLARIESLSRRIKPPALLQIGPYEINQTSHQIRLRGEEVELTNREFGLACYMFQNPGKLLSRAHLLEKLWGLNANVDTRTIDTHVSRIRRKLQIMPTNGWEIIPVYGFGYRIEKVNAAAH